MLTSLGIKRNKKQELGRRNLGEEDSDVHFLHIEFIVSDMFIKRLSAAVTVLE